MFFEKKILYLPDDLIHFHCTIFQFSGHYADQKQHHYNQKPRSRSVATPDCSRPAAFGFFSSKRPSIQNEIYNKEQQTSYYNWNRSNTIQ